MYDILIKQMRDEVTRLGAQELRTAAEVDEVLPNAKGVTLVVVNSTCGCAAGASRPALAKALQHSVSPDRIVTVFAGQDKEATARAREFFTDQPPSSPSFAFMRDSKFVHMIHRYQIEGHTADQVAATLTNTFEKLCGAEAKQAV
ncbi:MAG: BrxA/BrxB family bacilliredoxin [Ignavibacteriales bacterium]|nr:BrxA/BrxB family bacilliredoxin [Ignavibacteriales bacterium]